MKKYITIAALLAAGTAFSNAASVVLADQDELTTYSWTNAGGTGTAGNAGSSQLTLCLTAIDGLSDGDTVLLKSITLGQRTDNTNHAETIKFGAVMDGNTVTSFIAQSSAVDTSGTIMVNATTETTALKYVFDAGVEVIVGQSYNFALLASNGNLWVSNGSQNAPFAEVTTSDMVVSRGNNSYAPVYLVEAVSIPVIPEPSAFGLLAGVGALALVAARRRRTK